MSWSTILNTTPKQLGESVHAYNERMRKKYLPKQLGHCVLCNKMVNESVPHMYDENNVIDTLVHTKCAVNQ